MINTQYILTDDVWEEMANVFTCIKHKAGRPSEQSDRVFVEAVFYVARTGIPWRSLPQDFGHWDAVYKRFRRWERRGLWEQLWRRVSGDALTAIKTRFCEKAVHPQSLPLVKARRHTVVQMLCLQDVLASGESN